MEDHHPKQPNATEHGFLHANKQHFDDIACRYDQSKNAETLARKSVHAILDVYPFKEHETVVMDYACGTGLISRELAPHARSILGVDISQAMVDQYNLRVFNQGIPPEEMRAVCTELEGKDGELEGQKFDIIVCASAFHHMESIEQTTKILVHFLKPGGYLVVVDLEKTDADVHQNHLHIVPHPGGIGKADIQQAFQQAGLDSFAYSSAFDAKLRGIPVTLFIAKGIKPL